MRRLKFPACMGSAILSWLSLSGAYAQRSGHIEDAIQLALPFQTWGVRIENPGATVENREMKSGREAYLLASNPKNGIVTSIAIEKVNQPIAADECRTSLETKKDSFGSPAGARFTHITGKSRGSELPPSADVMEFLLDQNEFAA